MIGDSNVIPLKWQASRKSSHSNESSNSIVWRCASMIVLNHIHFNSIIEVNSKSAEPHRSRFKDLPVLFDFSSSKILVRITDVPFLGTLMCPRPKPNLHPAHQFHRCVRFSGELRFVEDECREQPRRQTRAVKPGVLSCKHMPQETSVLSSSVAADVALPSETLLLLASPALSRDRPLSFTGPPRD